MFHGEYRCPVLGFKIELPEMLAHPTHELLYCGTIQIGSAKGYMFSCSLEQIMAEADDYLGKFGLQCGYLEIPKQLQNEAGASVTVIGVMDHIEVYPQGFPALDAEDEAHIQKIIDGGGYLGEKLERIMDEINTALDCEKQ